MSHYIPVSARWNAIVDHDARRILAEHRCALNTKPQPTKRKSVEKLKAWALANYENGADTFVECWSDNDYSKLIAQEGSTKKALAVLRRLASVHAERQADARHYAAA